MTGTQAPGTAKSKNSKNDSREDNKRMEFTSALLYPAGVVS
jgi:hypothetical protein